MTSQKWPHMMYKQSILQKTGMETVTGMESFRKDLLGIILTNYYFDDLTILNFFLRLVE